MSMYVSLSFSKSRQASTVLVTTIIQKHIAQTTLNSLNILKIKVTAGAYEAPQYEAPGDIYSLLRRTSYMDVIVLPLVSHSPPSTTNTLPVT